MPAPSLSLRAGAALLAALVAVPVAAAPGTAASPAASPAAGQLREPETPLTMTIEELDRLTFNKPGPIVLRGTVTNHTDEAYDTVGVYPFLGHTPITSVQDLTEQTDLPDNAYVGDRILFEGDYDKVDELEPGETSWWTIRIRRQDVVSQLDARGVYWFGAHAIIPTGEAVETADGRARTFVPFLPRSTYAPPTRPTRPAPPDRPGRPAREASPRQVAMVVPLRRRVLYEHDGSIGGLRLWIDSLSSGGRLNRLLDVGRTTSKITWLLDPAVLDAVRRLAAGNPPRNLAPTDGGEPGRGPSPSTSASTSAAPEPSASPATDQATDAARRAAQAWLEELPSALRGNEVLALPYGDPDLAAVSTYATGLYATARQRGQQVLDDLGVDAKPAVAPPSGYLNPESLRMLDDNPMVIVSDRAVRGAAPPVANVDGRTVITTASRAAAGPGPGVRTAPVAVRQQAVSVAALRDRRPVVVMLPDDWTPPTDGDDLLDPFVGESWVELSTVTEATAGTTAKLLPSRRLTYPYRETQQEVTGTLVDEFTRLIASGQTLDRILPRNNEVAGEVTDEALTSLSYAARGGAGLAAAAAQGDLNRLLSMVRVEPPAGVILSSDSGDFSVTVVNDLDEPVTLTLRAAAAVGMDITSAQPTVDIPAGSTSSVRMTARAEQHGVHEITLQVTDGAGTAVGQSGHLPIRTGQASTVIWWFIGAGSALLLTAIVVRLVRRVRGSDQRDAEAAEPTG